MDEMEYRLRDLDVLGDSADRLPSAAELRRRGERKRTAARVRLAVATFAVVAVVAGGVTAFLGDSNSQTSGTPSSPVAPVTSGPSTTTSSPDPTGTSGPTETPQTPETSGQKEVLPNIDSDTLALEGGNYWIWAPPTADGRRGLALAGDNSVDLSLKNKKATDWLDYRGDLSLMPAGDAHQYQITNLPNSEEANSFCLTVIEAGFTMEVCDEGDAKQFLTFTKTKGGYLIGSTEQGIYLKAEGREITMTPEQSDATVFAVEKKAE